MRIIQLPLSIDKTTEFNSSFIHMDSIPIFHSALQKSYGDHTLPFEHCQRRAKDSGGLSCHPRSNNRFE